MTAAAIAPAPSRRLGSSRIGSVIRLYFANPMTIAVTPFIVLAAIFLLNLAIWAIVVISSPGKTDFAEGFSYSGSTAWIFFYMAVVAIQAMNNTFRLALGYGATRRDFSLGSSVVFVAMSAVFTATITVLGLLERATNGWGLQGRMFTPVYFGENWGERIAVIFCLFLFFTFTGSAFGSVFVRWGRNGLLIFGGILLAIVVLAGLVIALLDAWSAFGRWLDASLPLGLALWSLVPTAVFAVAGFLILRGATPKS
ncbi:ABC transporter permease [Pseudolysinimonas sp.]|uniref:ABC transporter permease n=1 Tax=Pseudolysinimonas sp. TaxID=2680009 RepID=UPI003F7CFB1D